MPTFRRISVEEANQKRSAGWAPYVLDVRAPHEAAIVRLAFADALIPHTEVGARLAEIPKDREILVYCKGGMRSAAAAQVLADAGYDAVNLEGGVLGWARAIDPSLPTY